MIASEVADRMRQSFTRIARWSEHLPPEQRQRSTHPHVLQELARRSYVDAYWRVCETTPLILGAIAALNRARDFTSADFWAEHLREELGHDGIQREDLARLFGDEVDAVLARHPMTPPSAAVIGYFRWQVERSPHLLMVYRMFQELFTASMPQGGRALRRLLGEEASRAVELHCELDAGHVQDCAQYIDAQFGAADRERLLWTVDFIGESFVGSQLYVAAPLLTAEPA